MPNRIRREYAHLTVTIKKDTCESEPFDPREFGLIQFTTPPAWTAAAMGIKVSPHSNSAYYPLYVGMQHCSKNCTVLVEVSSIQADTAYQFPSGSEGSGYARLWSQADGQSEDQAADRKLEVTLKG